MQRSVKDSRDRINILFEDKSCIVFDKPAGLLVIPTPKNEKNTLVNIVNNNYAPANSWKLHPCHRLDRETSGAILFAKGKKNQQFYMGLFKQKAIRKKYIAFIHGRLSKRTGVFKGMIKDIDEKKFRNHSPAKYAETHYKVIEERKLYSVVEVKTITGRTNQIRIHFSHNGHPLVGDRKYSIAKDYPLSFRRTALHASYLEWPSSSSKSKVIVVSELPGDMASFFIKNV